MQPHLFLCFLAKSSPLSKVWGDDAKLLYSQIKRKKIQNYVFCTTEINTLLILVFLHNALLKIVCDVFVFQ